jgi:hypothetical protein
MDAKMREAVRLLHRRKDAAYRGAWKKRGETLSILANIARKVDRLEYAFDGAPATQDESLFDTAVDLLIYALKYQTYLADQDRQVASTLFVHAGVEPPYSDGTKGFEELLDNLDLTCLQQANNKLTSAVASHLTAVFDDIVTCTEASVTVPIEKRAEWAIVLTRMAATLVGSLISEAPALYHNFLRANLESAHDAS